MSAIIDYIKDKQSAKTHGAHAKNYLKANYLTEIDSHGHKELRLHFLHIFHICPWVGVSGLSLIY